VSAGGSRLTVIASALRRPLTTEEIHRVTTFEVLFDLVFVFAIIRITIFVANPISVEALAEGILLVLLLWWSWSAFAWVGNQSRADTALVRAGVTVTMAAVFVAGLVIPDAWDSSGPMDPPVMLAVAFVVARLIYLALYLRVTAGGRPVRALSCSIPCRSSWPCAWSWPVQSPAAGCRQHYGRPRSRSTSAAGALGWRAALALYGGVAVYLVGRFTFVQLTARTAVRRRRRHHRSGSLRARAGPTAPRPVSAQQRPGLIRRHQPAQPLGAAEQAQPERQVGELVRLTGVRRHR
jgi:hypothetical protein